MTVPERRETESVAELVASRAELTGSMTRLIDFHVSHMDKTPAEAGAAARAPALTDPAAQEPQQVSWLDVARLIEREPEAGTALWQGIKDQARDELGTGMRVARALERPVNGRPWERAQFVALLAGLRESFAPRNPMEDLLCQQMAAAVEGWLRWQARATERTEEAVWQGERDRRRARERMTAVQRERDDDWEGWIPPRLTDAEATEQAFTLADRHQRMFLRLLRAFRDLRRLAGPVIVTGGQVNIGEQQVNVAADGDGR